MRIYLLRHGETDWNVARRLQGSMDIPLNAKGLDQAGWWRSYFASLPLAAVYSSSLDRALQTSWLATGRSACIIPGFNERGFGQWEGEQWQNLEKTVSEFDDRWNDNSFYPPGGESRQGLFRRVEDALDQTIRRHPAGEDVLIVAHGASGHAILSSLLGQSIDARGSLPMLRNAQLTIVEAGSGVGILVEQLEPYSLPF